MSHLTSIYVIQLEKGKFFVGASQDPAKALQMHREGLGPAWTQIHRPMHFHAIHPSVDSSQLDNYVKQYMAKYGAESVRGGSWENVRLKDQHRIQIRHEISNERSCVVM